MNSNQLNTLIQLLETKAYDCSTEAALCEPHSKDRAYWRAYADGIQKSIKVVKENSGGPKELNDIADAPTDGKPFLIYDARFKSAKIACLISKNPHKWRVSDDTLRYTLEDLREEFIGWLPLPKVNL
jgi:hypothetical protein